MYEKAGALPQELIDLLALWGDRYRAGQPYSHCPLMIAPDPDYTRPGHRRVIFFSRKPGPFAQFDRQEYLPPDAEVGPLVWALYEAPTELDRFARYQVHTSQQTPVRDLLVCTHGTVDIACAKFGYPLYRRLRDGFSGDSLRVWRVSHFGGHAFAPTVLEMPTGHFWAYLGEEQAEQIAQRDGKVAALRGHYRGWAGVESGFAQAAEREVWQREGWPWFTYAKSCTTLAADPDHEEPHWMELHLDYSDPHGFRGRYFVRVETGPAVVTRPSSGRSDTHAYPQYVVTHLEAIEN